MDGDFTVKFTVRNDDIEKAIEAIRDNRLCLGET